LLGGATDETDLEVFDTPEDYETEWKKLTGVEHHV